MIEPFAAKILDETTYCQENGNRVENTNLMWYPKIRSNLAKFVSTLQRALGETNRLDKIANSLKEDCLSTVKLKASSFYGQAQLR